jgi:hypothetical protein
VHPFATAQDEQADGKVDKFFLKLSLEQREEKRDIAMTKSSIIMKA